MSIVTVDKFYAYLWAMKVDPTRCKFGDRFVKAGQDPEKEVMKRIKASLIDKDMLKDGRIELDKIRWWDVTKIARANNRFKKNGKVDDIIRKKIGFRAGKTGDWHSLSIEDMEYKVNEYLKSTNQVLAVVGLSQNQHDEAVNVLDAINNGKRTILADLCTRFGKTIWAGALIRETNAPLTIIASYVLTSFTSFKNDLSRYEQFRDFVLIDAGADGWENNVKKSLKNGVQTVVFVSMCNGRQRQRKINFLFGLHTRRLMFLDEADYGIQKMKQSLPLAKACKPNDVVILMTGTNSDKATGAWGVDHFEIVTYPELLMEQALAA